MTGWLAASDILPVRPGILCPGVTQTESRKVGTDRFSLCVLSFCVRLRKETGDQTYWAPLDRHDTSLARSLLLSCYVPFSTFTSLVYRFPLTCSTPTQELLIFDRMALLLDIWYVYAVVE
jgi:hypothetical protein